MIISFSSHSNAMRELSNYSHFTDEKLGITQGKLAQVPKVINWKIQDRKKYWQINSGIPSLNASLYCLPAKDVIMPNVEADELTDTRKQSLLFLHLLLSPSNRRWFGWACFLQNSSPEWNVYYCEIAYYKDIAITQQTPLWPLMALGGTPASLFTKLPNCPELQFNSL